MADDIVLVKLGGSLITEKKSQTPKIRESNIKKISEIISKINKNIILVHGAGSYAHPLVKKYNIPVVPIYIERINGLEFKISINEPIFFSKETSIKTITDELNKVLEKMVIKNPDHWIWSHNRWK